MPLTPAHAAAALPLRAIARRLNVALPLSALVIGSMAPDFEYLLRLRPEGQFGHSALGLVTFCLPLGLAVWVAFRGWIVPAFLPLLPPGMAAALDSDARRTFMPLQTLLAAAAVLVGAASHVLWDAFTHDDGWVVARVPLLQERVAPDLIHGLRWYSVLQHLSTLSGVAVLFFAVALWIFHQPAEARRFAPGQVGRMARVAAALLGAVALGALANGARGWSAGMREALGLATVGAMATFASALFGYGLTARRRAERLPAVTARLLAGRDRPPGSCGLQ